MQHQTPIAIIYCRTHCLFAARHDHEGCQFAEHDPHAKGMALPEAAWPIVRYATAGVFEETLMCDTRMAAQLTALPQRFNSSILGRWTEETS